MKKTILAGFVLPLFLVLCFSSVFATIGDSAIISISLVNSDPDPAVAGDIVEVRLGIENSGGEATKNLVIELNPDYPFEMVPGEDSVKDVGTIKAYQTSENVKIIKFRLRVDRDANAGQYQLKFWNYEKGYRDIAKIQGTVNIDVKNSESAEVIYIDKTNLIPGAQSAMKFTVNNVGNAPLRDLTFNWENEDDIILPVGSDNTKYIKYIDIGENAEMQYQVIADTNAEPGLYKLNLYLTYDDPLSGEEKEISTIAGVYVGGETDFDVAFSESSSGQTSFSVANVGSNPAYSVSVVIPNQDSWKVSGSNSMIIGNLNKGDYTVASFTLQQSMIGGASGTTEGQKTDMEELIAKRSGQTEDSVKIQVYYTDTMGQRKTVEKDVNVNTQAITTGSTNDDRSTAEISSFKVRRQQGFFSNFRGLIITAVIVILGLIIYLKYKKKKKENPSFILKDFFKRKKKR